MWNKLSECVELLTLELQEEQIGLINNLRDKNCISQLREFLYDNLQLEKWQFYAFFLVTCLDCNLFVWSRIPDTYIRADSTLSSNCLLRLELQHGLVRLVYE